MTFYNIAYASNMFEIWQESSLVIIVCIQMFWEFAQFSLCSCQTTIGGLWHHNDPLKTLNYLELYKKNC